MADNISLGKKGEDQAIEFLRKNSFTILGRNIRTKYGEIDILASKKGILYCIEVKTRSGTQFGFPSEAINSHKLSRMRVCAEIMIEKLHFKGEAKLALVQILGKDISFIEL